MSDPTITDLHAALQAELGAHLAAPGPLVSYIWWPTLMVDVVRVTEGQPVNVARLHADPSLGPILAEFIESGLNRLPADARPLVAGWLARGAQIVVRYDVGGPGTITGILALPGAPQALFTAAVVDPAEVRH